MTRRTATASPAPRDVPRWVARDEWGTPVVLSGDGDDPDTIGKWFRAVDATAAAELAVEHLCSQGLVEGPTRVEVRCIDTRDAPWHLIAVNVWISVEYEVSARGYAKPEKLKDTLAELMTQLRRRNRKRA
ncbi:hypothetical protein [Lacipirellula sp.]|uniref:hypothetical protein n=1 Tax=Lacipirellula sp. TaxID=2691419 RepID=UPI003D1108E8